jgi:hypothetical protein
MQTKEESTDGIPGRLPGDEKRRQGHPQRGQQVAQAVSQAQEPEGPPPLQAPPARDADLTMHPGDQGGDG